MKRNFKHILVFMASILLYTSLFAQTEQKDDDPLRFSMKTKWSDSIDVQNPWNVYPRPQMKRDNWKNLNGYWEYAITSVDKEQPENYDGKILVPFAAESELSGVKKMVGEGNYLWYRKKFVVNKITSSNQWHLNFGAVDWEAVVYLNGHLIGSHKGGFTPFSFNIDSHLAKNGENELVVRVWDPTDSNTQARGKQVKNPKGIWYTPVTGIWQTVWLEKVPINHIKLIKSVPDIDKGILNVTLKTNHISKPLSIMAEVYEKGNKIVAKETKITVGENVSAFEIEIPNAKLWSPNSPILYDLKIKLISDKGSPIDVVESYFGMRKISLGKDANGYTRMMLNNQPLFQFGLLDQGWWPDGLYTAPTREAMVFDIDKTFEMGFNMLRKHVKVEPATFYYECDKKGMLVWQDMPNGNYLDELRIQAWEEEDAERSHTSTVQYERELLEMMDCLYSFPSIVVWVPLNEGWGQYDTERVASLVTSYDDSRLNDCPSGWADRGVGDLVDIHLYPGPGMEAPEANRASVIGEFGGLGLTVNDHMWWDKRNWGYLTFKDADKFNQRFEKLIDDLIGLKSQGLSAAVYTQTTDVEGEVNGLITYDRQVIKVDPKRTSELFKPLYYHASNKKVILPDAEKQATFWYVATNTPSKKWPKSKSVSSKDWEQQKAPFSSFDNYFLPEGSKWNPDQTLYLKRMFDLGTVPEQINFRYLLTKAKMKVYINGKLAIEQGQKGGRKRHYRNELLKNAASFLKKGENTISVELIPMQKDCSFDLGIYLASVEKGIIEEANKKSKK